MTSSSQLTSVTIFLKKFDYIYSLNDNLYIHGHTGTMIIDKKKKLLLIARKITVTIILYILRKKEKVSP